MFGQTSRVSLLQQDKETTPYKHMSRKERFFYLNLKTTFKNKYVNYITFYLQLIQCVYSTRSQFNDC